MNLTAPMWLAARRDPAHDRRPGTARSSTSRRAQAERRQPGLAAYIASEGRAQRARPASIAVDYAERRHPLQHDQSRLRRSTSGATPTSPTRAPRPRREGMHLTRLGVADDVALRGRVPRQPRVRVRHRRQPPARRRQQRRPGPDARVTRSACTRRASSARSRTFGWSLDEDLAFYGDARHHQRRDLGREARAVRLGRRRPRRVRSTPDCGSTNLIGLGPFHLAEPERWGAATGTARARARRRGRRVGAECLVFTTGPAGPLAWEEAADALEAALAPVLRRSAARAACRSRSSTRTRCGSTSASCTRLRDAIDLARRLDVGVCMEINACWAERGLADDDHRRRRPPSARAGQRLRGRARSRRRTGSSPATATSRSRASSVRCSTRATSGCFDLELIGPASRTRATTRRAGAASIGSPRCSTRLGAVTLADEQASE